MAALHIGSLETALCYATNEVSIVVIDAKYVCANMAIMK